MNGMAALVPLALVLADLAGGCDEAVELSSKLLTDGIGALERPHSDMAATAVMEAYTTGVIRPDGAPEPARAAELVVVCEILAAAPPPEPAPARESRLVFSAPPNTVAIEPHERLDVLVQDVIRRATGELMIAGAFWNEEGFRLLDEVLYPAVSVRGVRTTIYVNRTVPHLLSRLEGCLQRLIDAGPVTVRWYIGKAPTMLHAKVVVRDRSHGYLGTANLTSWGLREHIEAGVELGPGQSARLLAFFEELDAAGAFASSPTVAAA